MKLLVSALIVLSSAAAMATPAVGDYVKYDISVIQTGAAIAVTATLEQELVSYNAATNQYEQKNTTTTTSGASVSQGMVNAADLINDAGITQIMGNCASFGGTSVSSTTPAGTIAGCAVPVDNDSEHSTYVVGQVPFGIVAADIVSKSNGSHTTASLQSFRVGTK